MRQRRAPGQPACSSRVGEKRESQMGMRRRKTRGTNGKDGSVGVHVCERKQQTKATETNASRGLEPERGTFFFLGLGASAGASAALGASAGAGAAASGAGAACERASEIDLRSSTVVKEGQKGKKSKQTVLGQRSLGDKPSSSWAWEHPRARQQPLVRRPSSPQQGRGRQRRAQGQPAREQLRSVRGRAE